MPAIHLIKKHGGGLPTIVPVAGEANTYTSGFWTLSAARAHALIGGHVYFHEQQLAPSFFGGQIIDAFPTDGGEYGGKIVFKFVFSEHCRGVRAGGDGWSQEMKFVP